MLSILLIAQAVALALPGLAIPVPTRLTTKDLFSDVLNVTKPDNRAPTDDIARRMGVQFTLTEPVRVSVTKPVTVKRDVGTALFQAGKEYVYDYTATLMAGSQDYLNFASPVNFTGELHIQGGASVLNVQLNNVKLGLYNGPWSMEDPTQSQD